MFVRSTQYLFCGMTLAHESAGLYVLRNSSFQESVQALFCVASQHGFQFEHLGGTKTEIRLWRIRKGGKDVDKEDLSIECACQFDGVRERLERFLAQVGWEKNSLEADHDLTPFHAGSFLPLATNVPMVGEGQMSDLAFPDERQISCNRGSA